ncbi:MAG: porin family protein [Bacteroidaceae bacterium]|nr:porin family protein [Bacteroidaceae bacterium]
MKKNILSLAVIVAAFTFALPSQAQVKFGIKAGLNVNSVSLKDLQSNIKADNKTGFFAGVTADVTIPLAGLGADASLLYDNKVIGVTENRAEANKTLHYVDLPINLKYTIGLSSLASVYIATGPQFSWNVGDRNWKLSNYQGFTEDWELKKSEFSWNVGAGVTVLSHLRVGYNYNIGIGNTAETTVLGVGNQAIKGKLKNNTHQISLTYLF